MTCDQELWGVALWVEKTHGENGTHFIEQQVARLATDGDHNGIEMWRAVAERYNQLCERGSVN